MDKNKITLKFRSGSKSIEMGKGFEYRLLEKPTGLEGSEYNIDTENNNQYDGATVRDRRIEKRQISVAFEYPDARSAADKRNLLIGFFSPKWTGSLEVDYCGSQKYIEYEVVSIKDNQENLYQPLKMLVELICPDPSFKEIHDDKTVIETWIGGWQWQFSLPFKMRERGPQKATIINSGHVPTPVEIEFPGPALNPQVINQTTGEFVKVNQTLGPYDVLYINTAFGHKTVEISRDGAARVNAFNYIDLDSYFFELQVGGNAIEFKCDSADLIPQAVMIKYRFRYLGV